MIGDMHATLSCPNILHNKVTPSRGPHPPVHTPSQSCEAVDHQFIMTILGVWTFAPYSFLYYNPKNYAKCTYKGTSSWAQEQYVQLNLRSLLSFGDHHSA